MKNTISKYYILSRLTINGTAATSEDFAALMNADLTGVRYFYFVEWLDVAILGEI